MKYNITGANTMTIEQQRKIIARFYNVPLDRIDNSALQGTLQMCADSDRVGDYLIDALRSELNLHNQRNRS